MKAKLIDENETLRLEYLGVSYFLDYSERFILDILLEKCKEIGAEGIEDLDLETYEKLDLYEFCKLVNNEYAHKMIGANKQKTNYYFIKTYTNNTSNSYFINFYIEIILNLFNICKSY